MVNARTRFVAAILAVALVIGAGVLMRALSPRDCLSTPAIRQDFDLAVSVGEGIFESEQWRLETGEHPGLISVGWFDDQHEAIAHAQLLLYNCGYTQADLDAFYGEDGMNVMLGGYDSHSQTTACSSGSLTLREFDVVYDGRPYRVRFWFEPVSDTRVRDMHLGFFPADQALMDGYSARLYPQLPSCA